MSYVAFHTASGDAKLSGAERSHADILISQVSLAVLETGISPSFDDRESPMLHVLTDDCYLRRLDMNPRAWWSSFRVWWLASKHEILVGGQPRDIFPLQLNTVMIVGNDQLRLLARLHGQCEIHTYVEEANRSWFADVVEQGLASGLYRSELGWDDVIELARRPNDGPLVTSFSACESFPEGDDTFDEGMAKLRGRNGKLEIKLDGLAAYRFGHNLSVFDLLKDLGL